MIGPPTRSPRGRRRRPRRRTGSAWDAVPERHRPRIEADGQASSTSCGRHRDPGRPPGDPRHPRRPLRRPADMSAPWRTPGPADRIRRPGWSTWTAKGSTGPSSSPRWGSTSGPSTTPTPPWPSPAPTTTGWPLTAQPTRTGLFGAAMLPVQDPSAAAAELRRAHDELGFPRRLRPAQPVPGRSLVASRLRAHVGRGRRVGDDHRHPRGELGHRPHPRPRPALQSPHPARRVPRLRGDAGLRPADRLRRPERHPAICASSSSSPVAAGCHSGWSGSTSRRKASARSVRRCDCARASTSPRQCWISYEIDEQTLPLLAHLVGEERIVWGSDYPHHDATFPGAVERLREHDRSAHACRTGADPGRQRGRALRTSDLHRGHLGGDALNGSQAAGMSTVVPTRCANHRWGPGSVRGGTGTPECTTSYTRSGDAHRIQSRSCFEAWPPRHPTGGSTPALASRRWWFPSTDRSLPDWRWWPRTNWPSGSVPTSTC